MWCNVSFAEYIDWRKCHRAKFATYEQENNGRVEGKWIDDVLTINTDAGIVTRTIFKDSESNKKLSEILSELAGKKMHTNKIQQTIYKIENFAARYITAIYIEESPGTLTEVKLFVNLDKGEFVLQTKIIRTRNTIYGEAGEVGYESEREFKCDENFSQSTDDGQSGSSGTAFFINNRGNLITNNHVVEGCELSKINYFDKEYDTNLISTDKTLDLALLKVDLKPRAFISFSKKEPRKRQLIIVAGYPLGEYLSDDLKINEGKISSLKGFDNNSNEITVDIAINPGNSGGPIVDENGQLVAVAVAGMSKEVTEGISFGIKSSAVTNFLKTNKISPDIKLTSFSMNDEKVNQLLEESTVYIFCE